MFQEIPGPRHSHPPSAGVAAAAFGTFFVSFLVASVIIWLRWSGPMSLIHKIRATEYIAGSIASAAFLLSVKSVSPEVNLKRLIGLLTAITLFSLVIDILR